MNRAEELKQCFKTKANSTPDELLARYSKDHPELREAIRLANIAEIRVSLSQISYPLSFALTTIEGFELFSLCR